MPHNALAAWSTLWISHGVAEWRVKERAANRQELACTRCCHFDLARMQHG